jgi:hypothetical protein
MKTGILFISALLLMFSFVASAQITEQASTASYKKNTIGIQLNPYIKTNKTFSDFVYGARYGYRVSNSLTLGTEISGSFPAFLKYPLSFYDFRAGVYARYTFFSDKRIAGFLEASPFYSYSYIAGNTIYGGGVERNKFGLYVAPGVTLFTKNRKFSIDLYYKMYVHPGNMYIHENNLSYKLNFHF